MEYPLNEIRGIKGRDLTMKLVGYELISGLLDPSMDQEYVYFADKVRKILGHIGSEIIEFNETQRGKYVNELHSRFFVDSNMNKTESEKAAYYCDLLIVEDTNTLSVNVNLVRRNDFRSINTTDLDEEHELFSESIVVESIKNAEEPFFKEYTKTSTKTTTLKRYLDGKYSGPKYRRVVTEVKSADDITVDVDL